MIEWLLDIFQNPFLIARIALGKFIILAGCILHIAWAMLLLIDEKSAGSSPLSAIYMMCDSSRILTILFLILAAGLAMRYLVEKSHHKITLTKFGLLMFPQLWALALSLVAAVYAVSVGYYIDTVAQPGYFILIQRPHLLILADQLPVMVLSLLYLTAVIFASTYKGLRHNGSDARRS
jgi:hypothetical protein